MTRTWRRGGEERQTRHCDPLLQDEAVRDRRWIPPTVTHHGDWAERQSRRDHVVCDSDGVTQKSRVGLAATEYIPTTDTYICFLEVHSAAGRGHQ